MQHGREKDLMRLVRKVRKPAVPLACALALLAPAAGCDSPMDAAEDLIGGELDSPFAPSAEMNSDPPPISIEPLTDRHEFTDDAAVQIRLKPAGRSREIVNLRDASNVFVAEITVQPGARFPWHTHPGPVLVAVTEGDLVYIYADDCVQRPYASAEAFVDPGFDNVHMAFNPSGTEEAVLVAIFLGAPDAGPLTIPVEPEEGAALDEKCGL